MHESNTGGKQHREQAESHDNGTDLQDLTFAVLSHSWGGDKNYAWEIDEEMYQSNQRRMCAKQLQEKETPMNIRSIIMNTLSTATLFMLSMKEFAQSLHMLYAACGKSLALQAEGKRAG